MSETTLMTKLLGVAIGWTAFATLLILAKPTVVFGG